MPNLTGASVGNYDGYLWGRSNFEAGRATGNEAGYDSLTGAMDAGANIEGAELITEKDGKYYLNEIRGTHYSQESRAEVTVRSDATITSSDGQDYVVVGFLDDYNNFITQHDGDENLEMMGQSADIQQLLDTMGENISLQERMALLGAAQGIDSPRLMDTMDKLSEALSRMPQYLPEALQEKFGALVEPENLALIAGTLAIWGASHAVGVGQIADGILIGTGLAFLGAEAIEVAKKIYDFVDTAVHAETEADLESAAQSLADGIASVMVEGAVAAATYGASRVLTPGASGAARMADDELPPRSTDADGVPPVPDVEPPVARPPSSMATHLDDLPLGELRQVKSEDLPPPPAEVQRRVSEYEADLEPGLNAADSRVAVRQRMDEVVSEYQRQGLEVKTPGVNPIQLVDVDGNVAVRVRFNERESGSIEITDLRNHPPTLDQVRYRSPEQSQSPSDPSPRGATESDTEWFQNTNRDVGMPTPAELSALKGTRSHARDASDFAGLQGSSIEDIMARIPEDAQLRELSPGENNLSGFEYSWKVTENGPTMRVRIHGPDPSAPVGSDAHQGWIVRVRQGGHYLDSQGTLHPESTLNERLGDGSLNPRYNAEAANRTHIPIATPSR